ncbi:twin-arginine translocation signal domain-containing protein [Synechococcus sp. CCY 0621]|uniref:twin-arginine translocation signal domain-containing protein n=1 Tax=Synechococcus sp. CCY 0621 TaxID=2815603 RepID=UPI001C21F5AC
MLVPISRREFLAKSSMASGGGALILVFTCSSTSLRRRCIWRLVSGNGRPRSSKRIPSSGD